jgi:hypothetical protein
LNCWQYSTASEKYPFFFSFKKQKYVWVRKQIIYGESAGGNMNSVFPKATQQEKIQ